jgi:hypothetical protein
MPHAEAGRPEGERRGRIGKEPRGKQGRQKHDARDERIKPVVQRPLVEIRKGRRDRLKAVAPLHTHCRHHQRPAGNQANHQNREHQRPEEHQRPDDPGKGQPPVSPHEEPKHSPRQGEQSHPEQHEGDRVETRRPPQHSKAEPAEKAR